MFRLTFLVLTICAILHPGFAQVLPTPITLPNGWSLSPAGRSFPLGDLPLNMAISQSKNYLAVTNKRTGDHYVTACTLPAQIGRQHESNNQVLLDCMDKKIPRVHIVYLIDLNWGGSITIDPGICCTAWNRVGSSITGA